MLTAGLEVVGESFRTNLKHWLYFLQTSFADHSISHSELTGNWPKWPVIGQLNTAVKRMGSADEIAKVVLFLASDDASFITGNELITDGGFINYALK